jgi:hypothetical protein
VNWGLWLTLLGEMHLEGGTFAAIFIFPGRPQRARVGVGEEKRFFRDGVNGFLGRNRRFWRSREKVGPASLSGLPFKSDLWFLWVRFDVRLGFVLPDGPTTRGAAIPWLFFFGCGSPSGLGEDQALRLRERETP